MAGAGRDCPFTITVYIPGTHQLASSYMWYLSDLENLMLFQMVWIQFQAPTWLFKNPLQLQFQEIQNFLLGKTHTHKGKINKSLQSPYWSYTHEVFLFLSVFVYVVCMCLYIGSYGGPEFIISGFCDHSLPFYWDKVSCWTWRLLA